MGPRCPRQQGVPACRRSRTSPPRGLGDRGRGQRRPPGWRLTARLAPGPCSSHPTRVRRGRSAPAEYSRPPWHTPACRPPCRSEAAVTLAPWNYLFLSFSSHNFPDLFHPTWIASLVLLVVLLILYNVRTRALHRHQPYLDLWEWLWWTGLITFSLLMIESLFVFDFILVLATLIAGL